MKVDYLVKMMVEQRAAYLVVSWAALKAALTAEKKAVALAHLSVEQMAALRDVTLVD